MNEYRTSRGRLFALPSFEKGEYPLDLFDRGEWLKCLHACMAVAQFMDTDTRSFIEDDGILHELVHLSLGVNVCTHNSMDDLRRDVEKISKFQCSSRLMA